MTGEPSYRADRAAQEGNCGAKRAARSREGGGRRAIDEERKQEQEQEQEEKAGKQRGRERETESD